MKVIHCDKCQTKDDVKKEIRIKTSEHSTITMDLCNRCYGEVLVNMISSLKPISYIYLRGDDLNLYSL